MKTIEKKKVITDHYFIYVAVDGTEFTNEEECRKYENSALGVLKAQLKDLTVNTSLTEASLFNGVPDNTIVAVRISEKKDIDTVMQLLFLVNPWYLSDDSLAEKERDKMLATLKQVYRTKDILLLGLNYDNEYYFIGSREEIINKLNNLDKKQNKNEN